MPTGPPTSHPNLVVKFDDNLSITCVFDARNSLVPFSLFLLMVGRCENRMSEGTTKVSAGDTTTGHFVDPIETEELRLYDHHFLPVHTCHLLRNCFATSLPTSSYSTG